MFRDGNMKIMYINGYVKKIKPKQWWSTIHQYQQNIRELKQWWSTIHQYQQNIRELKQWWSTIHQYLQNIREGSPNFSQFLMNVVWTLSSCDGVKNWRGSTSLVYKISWTQHFLLMSSVPNQEDERSCICMLRRFWLFLLFSNWTFDLTM